MPKGTLYEGRPTATSPFSFGIEVPTDVCESMADGTLPTAIPAVVIDPPTGGRVRSLYDVLELDESVLGPVRILEPTVDPLNENAVVPVKKGDRLTLQVFGRAAPADD